MQKHFNPTTFLSNKEDQMCEQCWTLPDRLWCEVEHRQSD